MNKKIIFPVVDAKGKPLKKQPENIRAVLDCMGLTVRYNTSSKDGLARRMIAPGTKNRTSEEIILLDRLEWDSSTDKWTWRLLSDLCIMLDIPNNRIRLLGRAISRLMLEDNRIKKNTNHHSNATYLLPPVRGADEEI